MKTSHLPPLLILSSFITASLPLPALRAADSASPTSVTTPTLSDKIQKPTSEDPLIPNFHSLGDIAHRSNIYRAGNPIDSLADSLKGREPDAADGQQAKEKVQHLYDLGIRTVVSLQRQEPLIGDKPNPAPSAVQLEKTAEEEVGITYIAYSMANRGKDSLSLQVMPDDVTFKLVQTIGDDMVKRSETGGVLLHCKSGKDRTGLVAGYLPIKYQQWDIDRALAEMRANGHVWKSFLKPGCAYSWHEQHLQAIAKNLAPAQP